MVVDHSRQQVVRRADGMEVAREMEIDVLHRRDLRIAAPGRPALEAEHRPERRLAQSEHRILAQQPQRVAKADRRGGLALPGGCRVDCRDQDQLARLPAQRVHLRQIELGLIASVRLERRLVDPGQTRDLSDREQGGLPRDFQIRFHADSPLHSFFISIAKDPAVCQSRRGLLRCPWVKLSRRRSRGNPSPRRRRAERRPPPARAASQPPCR